MELPYKEKKRKSGLERKGQEFSGVLRTAFECETPRPLQAKKVRLLRESAVYMKLKTCPRVPSRDLEFLWREFFRDPLQWWDNRSNKNGPGSPDFKHRATRECLWLDNKQNPPWVHQELSKSGPPVLSDLSQEERSYVALLSACAKEKDIDKGTELHDSLQRVGLLVKSRTIANTLISMYAKCGALAKARQLLHELPARDVVSWSALISGYTQLGQCEKALHCFELMQQEGISPNAVTFSCILKACGSVGAADKGKEIHDEIVRQGLLEGNAVLGTALIDMYAKCGALVKAQLVLDQLQVRNVVSWGALIAGYVQHEQGEKALSCFNQMQQEGHSPNAIIFTCVLRACATMRAIDMGIQIHDTIRRKKMLQKDVVLANSLVEMYVKCCALSKAQEVVDKLSVRNVSTWGVIMVGYTQQGLGEEALNCYERMQKDGFQADEIALNCVLKACGIIGALDRGKEIHNEIVSQGLLKSNIVLGNSLVDMYAKCGALAKAHDVLDELPVRTVVAWSALIAGYAQQGQSWEALNTFERMQSDGTPPNAFTMASVLNACSHAGLLDEGQMYFTTMGTKYGITADVEIYTCMVDLFGRAGDFEKALAIINEMSCSDHLPVWRALLGACRKWGNVTLGRFAFDTIVRIDKHDGAAYILMYNIYAAAGMQEAANEIDAMRVKSKAQKKPGHSWWISGSGRVHSFVVGDTNHEQNREIQEKLLEIAHKLSQNQFSPSLHWVSQNISDDRKKELLCQHSEKLAIACALVNTSPGITIHIVKNMRVCGDCHTATALLSKLEKRKIVIRDANRFHSFEDGKCSCGDYW